ncbi:MAG: PDZ domain-containing protein, partial [Cyclobacteriaceae bacterium]
FAKEKDLKVTEGVYVDSVMANSAAGESGIKEGDVIKEVNGVTIKSTGELLELIGRHRPGDEVNLMVDRFGKMKEFKVTLKNLQGKTKLAEKGEMEILDVLGVELEEVDNKIAKKLDIEGGLKIKKLHPGKLKKYTDVREGFIITKIDGKQVTSPEELVNLLKNKEGGVMIEGVYEDYPGKYYYAFGL